MGLGRLIGIHVRNAFSIFVTASALVIGQINIMRAKMLQKCNIVFSFSIAPNNSVRSIEMINS